VGNSVAAAMIVPSGVSGHEPSNYVMRLPGFPSPDRDARWFAWRQPGGSAAGAAEVAKSRQPPRLSPSFSKSQVVFAKLFQRKLWRFCGISRGCKGRRAIKYRFPNFSPPPAPFRRHSRRPHTGFRRPARLPVPNRKSRFPNSCPPNCALKAPPDQDPGKIEVLKNHPSTNFVFPKQNGRVGIENRTSRVVVGPDPLIVGSSAARHHHILDAAHPSRQAAQGLSRLVANPERGRASGRFVRPRSTRRDARGFRNRIRDFAVNGQRMSWPRHL
jgi:hypothetical protein